MGRLDGKICVITGAGGGMGRDAAILFTEEGAQVCAADVNLEAAEETVALTNGNAFANRVDVADEASVQSMMAATAGRFGGIDVLYNNAGISPADDASVLDTSVEAWDRVQAVNTKGEEFGEERLAACVEAIEPLAPDAQVARILETVQAFAAGTRQADDLTALVLRYRPTV